MSEDRCIACGDIVPEGRMVCPICEKGKPTADVVEVIRCRECRWYSKEQDGWGICFHTHSNHLYVPEDFYCAYGKRREKTDAEIH